MLESGEVLFEGNLHVALLSGPLRTATSTSSIICSDTRCSIRRPTTTTPCDWLLRTATSRSSNDCCKTSASIRRPTTTTPCDGCCERPPRGRRTTAARQARRSVGRRQLRRAMAAENGHLAVVERLLQDKRVDPSADDNYAVRWAAVNGHLAVVERLLQDKRVDPSADDNYAVRWAAANGHLAVVERLLQDKRVDPSADDNYAVRLGCSERPPRGRRSAARG
jgi:hypothetical protein